MGKYFATWDLAKDQARTQQELRTAVDAQGATPCRNSRLWDDRLPGERVDSKKRQARIEWAIEACLGCPLMSNECKAIKDNDDTIRGVIAGVLISDYETKAVAA
jgi:hypothetical protein